MRRPFFANSETYQQVINKQIQLFNQQWVTEIEDEMYYLSENMTVQTISRTINDLDYLINSFNAPSNRLLSDYLQIRENLIRLRRVKYSEQFP